MSSAPGRQARCVRVEAERLDRCRREQRKAVRACLGAGAFQQAVDDDDVRPGELVPAGDATPDEGAMVDEHLKVELGGQSARVAVAGRGLVDAPQSTPEGEVGRLDRVEQQGPVGASVLDEQEGRVTLELGQSERWLQPADDRLQEVTGDGRRVLDLAPRQVRGVAGQVGDDQEAGLGCRCHAAHRRPWSRSNVKTPVTRGLVGRRGDVHADVARHLNKPSPRHHRGCGRRPRNRRERRRDASPRRGARPHAGSPLAPPSGTTPRFRP